MRIECDSCGAAYAIDDKLITDRGVRAQCPKCGAQKVVKSDPAAGGDNPFGAPPGGAPAGGNPFGAPAGGAPDAGANPFGAPAPAPDAGANPFGAPPGAAPDAGANPFGAPAGGAPAGGAPAGGNPFGAPATGAQPNPFGAPAGGSPFGAPASGAQPNPFGAPAGGAPAGGNPFGAPATGAQPNPFGAPAAPASGAQPNPFGAPAGGGAPDASGNPFGAPAGEAAGGGSPFGGGGGDPAPAPSGDPFGGDNPFAPPPDETSNPFGDAPSDDPFAKLDGDNQADAVKWQVKRGKESIQSDLTLTDVRDMVRKGTLGPNDLAAPEGKSLRPVAEDPILAVSLPKAAGSRGVAGASAVGGSKKGLAFLIVALLVGAGGYGAYVFAPGFFEKQSDAGVNPIRRAKNEWLMEFPDVEGTSQEHVVEGRKFMRADTAAGYRQADEQFRQALLLDVSNLEAIAGYAENFAYLPNARADHEGLRLAQDAVDWGLRVQPKDGLLLRAKGALYLANNDHTNARSTLKQASKQAPDDNFTLLLQAQAALKNTPKEALSRAERVLRRAPDMQIAYLVTGAAHRRLGHFKKARQQLNKRLEADPGNVATLKEYALLDLDMGNGAEAMKKLQKALSAEERDVEARLMLAKVAYQVVGNRRLAKKELKFILDNYAKVAGDNLLPTYAHNAYLMLLDGKKKEAKEHAMQALNLRPSYAPALYVLGRIEMADKNYETAVARLEAAASAVVSGEDSGNETVVRSVLGDALVAAKRPKDALKNYARVAEYFPRYIRGFFAPAALYIKQGKGSQAATMIRRALDIDPHHDDDRRTITDYPAPASDLVVYAEIYRKSKVGKDDPTLRYSAEGMIRFAAGQKDKARALLKKTLKDDRYSHAALLYLAVMDVDARRYKEAEKKLKSAMKTTAGAHTITHLYLARAELGQKKKEEALKRLEKVVDNEATLAAARFTLGEAHLANGDKEKAFDVFRQVVREHSDFLPVKRRLAKLE